MTEHHGPKGAGSRINVHEFQKTTKATGPKLLALEPLMIFVGSCFRTSMYYESETRLAGASQPSMMFFLVRLFVP